MAMLACIRPTTLLLLHWKAFQSILLVEAFFISPSRTVIDATNTHTARRKNNGSTSHPIRTPSMVQVQRHRHHGVVPTEIEEVDVCIIGGGVSGLTAAICVAQKLVPPIIHDHDTTSPPPPPSSILLLESSSSLGGRVQSDITSDGYILDKGFAVFIEEYPMSKQLLDYDALGLQPFLPGARVKLLPRQQSNRGNVDDTQQPSLLACVSDPIRRPNDILKIITSPVGSLRDKLLLAPLFYTIFTRSIEDLFTMEEMDTLSCLRSTYHFSEEFISTFFAPFLEGIYLAPLDEQSSRMFHFVMKMFAIGNVSLPTGGMQAVSNQLDARARNLGVDIHLDSRVVNITQYVFSSGGNNKLDRFVVEVDSKEGDTRHVNARCVVIATDVGVASKLLGDISASLGLEHATKNSLVLPPPKQRSVGCIYYGFQSPAPLTDPILILNGEGGSPDNGGRRNTKDYPINNVCFPSVVHRGDIGQQFT